MLALLASALLLALVLSIASGALSIPLTQFPGLIHPQTTEHALWQSIVLEVRLPRALLAALTGAALALCGAVMQALFRNPLAEPGLVGISAGGALGAVGAIVLGATSSWTIAPSAFGGSLLATTACYVLGRRQHNMAGLLLAGIAINALCGSLINLLTYFADPAQLRGLTFWTMGNLGGATWPLLAELAPWTLALSVLLWRDWRALNALLLGEREASHLGFAIKPLRRRLIVMVALLVGPLVGATGTIGFVGLVVPHLVRLLSGANHRWLLPNSMLGGAAALTGADWLARTLMPPAELPIGVVTSLVGAPFFLWLLARKVR
ncbi:iron ABC transporter permease [Silvimonas sp. JCM 19000]